MEPPSALVAHALSPTDTCRICSAPAEPDQPLFHPCKCSGTIRYIHQDCLKEWLAHSKRKACDVCKHPYSFTKVYSKDMPDRLPVLLIMRQVSNQIVSAILFVLRAALVATVWLAALPWLTIWTWRFYFTIGNTAAWWISALERPPSDTDSYGVPITNTSTTNNTSPPADTELPATTSLFAHPRYKAVSSDIFAGQVIASIIVLTFVAIFLLREWITQNARPGIFEDGDIAFEAGVQDALPENPPAPPAAQQLAPPPVPHPPTPPPVIAEPAHDQIIPGGGHAEEQVRAEDLAVQSRVKKPRKSSLAASEDGQEPGPPSQGDTSQRKAFARERRRREYRAVRFELFGPEVDPVEVRKKRYNRFKPRPERWATGDPDNGSGAGSSKDLPAISEFTFRAPGPAYPVRPVEPGDVPPVPTLPFAITSRKGKEASRSPLTSPPRHSSDSDDDARERTPTAHSPPPPPAFSFNLPPESRGAGPSTTPTGPRRPPLPSITLPPSPLPSTSSPNPLQAGSAQTPLASPSLATYRAPEELDVDVRRQRGYFVQDYVRSLEPETFIDPNIADEHRHYFRDPDDGDEGDLAEDEDEYGDEDGYGHEGGYMDGDGDDVVAEGEDGDETYVLDDEHAEIAEMADDEQEDGEWTDEEGMPHLEPEEDEEMEDEEERENIGPGEGVLRIREEARQRIAALNERDGLGPQERRGVRAELAQPVPELALQDELDAEVNIEDDMDGALEAIGLRGPLVGVLQNAILMTFILDTTIGLGIWLPFMIGKSSALLTLNPRRAAQLLHLPLRVIRFVTDPVVDSVLLLSSRAIVPLAVEFFHTTSQAVLRLIANLAGHSRADQLSDLSTAFYDRVTGVASQVMEHLAPTAPSPPEVAQTEPTSSYLYQMLEEDTTVMRAIEPVFAPFGKNVREWSGESKATWVRFATGDTPNDRVFAVVLGYAVVGLLLAIYLNILTVGSMRSAGRAVRHAVRQQLLVVKVAAFIIIELVIFPLGCGVMLDMCTVWLFPQGSFRSRAMLLMYAPVTAVFNHWVLGTMFMYQFAVLLSGCRSIMRPGAMWFIKDPQDQNFHPIRDILERPTFVQIRKLVLSALMYALVVVCGVATVSGILRVFSQTIMPFRWKIREPLSEVPIDLILLQWVLPHTMESFRPRRTLRRLGNGLWKYLASRLRLSSYMFGGRYPSEEYSPKEWSWRMLLVDDGMQMDDAEAIHDGCFRRVPNNDNVALVKDSPATAEVREDGTPVDEKARKLIDAQNAEAQKAKRQIKKDYTVVYIPPNIRYRIILFLFCLWVAGSILLAIVLAAPILMGRAFFRMFTTSGVHDGYSFIVGFYLLWGCFLFSSAIDRLDKRRQRRWTEGTERGSWTLFAIKRGLLWATQALYMVVALGVVIPTLVGLVFELYIVFPIRHTANPLLEPRIRIVDMWALGLLYSRIILRVISMQQPGRGDGLIRGIDRTQRLGWIHMDPMRTTTDVIVPLTVGLSGMIVLPAVVFWGLLQFVHLPVDEHFLFLHVYPGIFTAAGIAHATFAFSKITTSWSQTIRDKEFIVEMRLRNLDPDSEKRNETESTAVGVNEELPATAMEVEE